MTVLNVTQMLAVADVGATVQVLLDCLGLPLGYRAERYAYAEHDRGGIRLIGAPPDADMDDTARERIVSVDAGDVDAFFDAHRAALEAFPAAKMRSPLISPIRSAHCMSSTAPFFS